MVRSFVAVILIAGAASGCAGTSGTFKDIGENLKEAGVAFYKDVKEEIKKEVAEAIPEITAKAEEIVAAALEKQAAELKAKELAKLDAQLATLPPETHTDPITGVETQVVRKALDFDGANGQPKDGDIDEKEIAALGKWYGTRLAALTAEGVMDAGQLQQHATGTGITMAAILAIMAAKKGGRQALANLLRTGGSATGGVAG